MPGGFRRVQALSSKAQQSVLAETAIQSQSDVAGIEVRGGPPPRLRRSGATALARLAEPELGEAERRLVDLSWTQSNPIVQWLRLLDGLRTAGTHT